MKKRAMFHPGHRHRQPPQYELGHVHHLLLLKSETAKQLLSYKYIAVKISMRKYLYVRY